MTTTKESQKHLDVLHFEHERWSKQLDFCTDELSIYKNRLAEIASRYTDNEVLAKSEHFQNQFILQQEVIDTLSHDINLHEEALVKEAKENMTAVDRRFFNDHGGLRDKMETFVKLFNELKNDYMRYLSKYM
jgi:hypothetical protein